MDGTGGGMVLDCHGGRAVGGSSGAVGLLQVLEEFAARMQEFPALSGVIPPILEGGHGPLGSPGPEYVDLVSPGTQFRFYLSFLKMAQRI